MTLQQRIKSKFHELEKRFTWTHAMGCGAVFLAIVIGYPVVSDIIKLNHEARILKDCQFAHKKPCELRTIAVPKEA